MSASVVDAEIVVVDGGDDGNPTICPPEGVNWRVLSVRDGIHLHVEDKHDPSCGLTFCHVDGALPFARDVVLYFCFPTLGVPVPLRPGDFLIFNALIPYCVLLRCRQVDQVMVISMYLKSAVVGMNNNDLPLKSK